MTEKLYELMNWADVEEVTYSESTEPKRILGPHLLKQGLLIQSFLPTAKSITVELMNGESYDMELADEAGFFALHIVNAELDGNIHHTMEAPEIIDDIISIVKYTYKRDLDEDSFSYERFITHLKYFLQRAERNAYYEPQDPGIFEIIMERFPEAYNCATRIKSYMESKYPEKLTDEEMLYLTVHIARITDRD